MGVFQKIAGLLLGTFTEAEKAIGRLGVTRLIQEIVDDNGLPIAKTQMVGHAADSKCLVIGKYYKCSY